VRWYVGLALLACVSGEQFHEDVSVGDAYPPSGTLRGQLARGHRAADLHAARKHGRDDVTLPIPSQWVGEGFEGGTEEAPPQNVSGVFRRTHSLKVKRRAKDIRFKRRNSNQQRQVLLNHGDVQYVTHLNIGQQIIAGIIDTGSASLVVFPRSCTSCGIAARYDPGLSANHAEGRLSTKHVYGTGVAFSEDASDLVSFGPFPETRQTFWEVIQAHMPVLRRTAFEAIIGLGPPEATAVDAWSSVQESIRNISAFLDKGRHAPEPLYSAVEDGLDVALETSKNPNMLDNFGVKTFSVCLGVQPGTDGYLIWNDPNPFDRPEIFTRIPVVGNRTWSVRMEKMRLVFPHGEQAIQAAPLGNATQRETDLGCGAGCSALIDSGTSLLTLPTSAINQLELALEGLKVDCSNLEQLPELAFEMGGSQFSLPPDAYVSQMTGTVPSYLEGSVRFRRMSVGQSQGMGLASCQLLLLESSAETESGPLWVLGVPFFRKYYTSFHLGERRSERAVLAAAASEDCTPAGPRDASAARARPFRRHIDPAKVHIPQTVEQAATAAHVTL